MFPALLDRALDAIISMDQTGAITGWNLQAEIIFGWAAHEVVGRSVESTIIPSHDRQAVSLNKRIETVASHRDGYEFPVELAICQAADEPPEFVAFIRDLTRAKRTERALQESEARYRLIIQRALDAVVTMDTAGVIRGWNPQAEVMFGWTSDEAIGRTVEETIVPVQHRAAHAGGLQRYLATGEGPVLNQRIEITALRRDGSEFPVDLAISYVEGDRPYFNAFISDITVKSQAEQRQRLQYAVTRVIAASPDLAEATPQILEAVCDTLDWDAGALWTVDAASSVLRCANVWHRTSVDVTEFESMTSAVTMAPGVGLPGRCWVDGQAAWIADVQQDGNFPRLAAARANDLHGAFAFAIGTGSDTLGVMEFFSRHSRPLDDGLLATMTAIGSQIAQFIERRKAEEALAVARDQALDASRAKSAFLANMSHELRTPLNAIIGYSEMLSKQMLGALTEDQLDSTVDILNAGRHLLTLINDILDLSKVEAGKMELDLSTFDIRAGLDMALTMVKERAAKQGIQLLLEMELGVDEIEGDELKFKQVILNLLSNAVKFTPAGGSVRVCARKSDDSVEIAVRDTGVGIAPEDQPKVFQEFEQVGTAAAVKKEGTGLGLPLAKRYVELHGGRMWLESAPGEGSAFIFTIPIVRQPVAVSVGSV